MSKPTFIATTVADEINRAYLEQAAREGRSRSFVLRRALVRDLRRSGHVIPDPTVPSYDENELSPEVRTPGSATAATGTGGRDESYRRT